MAISKRNESRSFSTPFRDDDTGKDVLVANCTYSERLISVNFQFIDSEFCMNNREEIEKAISTFLADVNDKLAVAELPSIHTNDAALE